MLQKVVRLCLSSPRRLKTCGNTRFASKDAVADRKTIEEFLAQQHLAVVGISRDTKQFANVVYRQLSPEPPIGGTVTITV